MWQIAGRSPRKILCLGAHSDDIEIGCGGTIIRAIAENPNLEVCYAAATAPGKRATEARQSAKALLSGAKNKRVKIGSFRESYFPSEWPAIKDWVEEIRSDFEPDVVFTHFRDDRHQDHRVLSDLAWNTFRNHVILEYEIPKWDGDLGHPNFYIPLSDEAARRKVEILMRYFKSQQTKHWFTEDLFLGLMRIRGVECGAHYAEAFHARKIVVS